MWGMYFERVHDSWGVDLWDAMKSYLLALPRRTGRAEDALVSADVYWVSDHAPRASEHEPYGLAQVKLFSFEAPAPSVARKNGD
jgi:hypothetical protein